MPFNPVYNIRVANIWLQHGVEDSTNRTRSRSETSSPSIDSSTSQKMPISGPRTSSLGSFLPNWSCLKSNNQLGYVHVAFWAVFLYVLGSVVYLVDSVLLWPLLNPNYSDDYQNPAIYLNTVGAAVFVLDAIVCFADWNLQIRQLKMAEKLAKGDLLTGIAGISYSTSWLYFFNNVFFLAASLIYLVQALWYRAIAEDLLRCERIICDAFWINFFGGLFYFASSYFCVLEYYEYQKMRRKQKLPPMLLFTCKAELFDWFGWGDWLYVVTSLLAFVQSFFIFTNIDEDSNYAFNLFVNFLFLVDSLAYFVGYILFLQEIEEAFHTRGIGRSQLQTAYLSELLSKEDLDAAHAYLVTASDQSLSPRSPTEQSPTHYHSDHMASTVELVPLLT